MPSGEKPRGAIQDWTDILTIPGLRSPSVQRHADGESAKTTPVSRLQATLGGQRGLQGILRSMKSSQEAIPSTFDHDPTLAHDSVPYQHIVLSERMTHSLGLLFPLACAALNVGEQEGDGPGW